MDIETDTPESDSKESLFDSKTWQVIWDIFGDYMDKFKSPEKRKQKLIKIVEHRKEAAVIVDWDKVWTDFTVWMLERSTRTGKLISKTSQYGKLHRLIDANLSKMGPVEAQVRAAAEESSKHEVKADNSLHPFMPVVLVEPKPEASLDPAFLPDGIYVMIKQNGKISFEKVNVRA